jgi:hypothetical protein
MQSPYEEHMMMIRKLYEGDVVKISSIMFEFCTAEDHSKQMIMLE